MIKEKLSKEEYENIIKIKNIRKDNKIDEKSENANINIIYKRKFINQQKKEEKQEVFEKKEKKAEIKKYDEKKEEIIEKPIKTSVENSVEKYSRYRRRCDNPKREKEENRNKFGRFHKEYNSKTNEKEKKEEKSKNYIHKLISRKRLFNKNPEKKDELKVDQKIFRRTYFDGFRRHESILDDKNPSIYKTFDENENNKTKSITINSMKDISNIKQSNFKLSVENMNNKYLQNNNNIIKNISDKKNDIIKKNIIKGLLDIKLKDIKF